MSSSIYKISSKDKAKAKKEGKSIRDIIREREQEKRFSKTSSSRSKKKTIYITPKAAEVIQATQSPEYKGRVTSKIIEAQEKLGQSEVKVIQEKPEDKQAPSLKRREQLYTAKAYEAIQQLPEKERERILNTAQSKPSIVTPGQPVSAASTAFRAVKPQSPESHEGLAQRQATRLYGSEYWDIPKEQRPYYEIIASEASARQQSIQSGYDQGRISYTEAKNLVSKLNRDIKKKIENNPFKSVPTAGYSFEVYPDIRPQILKDASPIDYTATPKQSKYSSDTPQWVQRSIDFWEFLEQKQAEGTGRVRTLVEPFTPDIKIDDKWALLAFPTQPLLYARPEFSNKPLRHKTPAGQYVQYMAEGVTGGAAALPDTLTKIGFMLPVAAWSASQEPGNYLTDTRSFISLQTATINPTGLINVKSPQSKVGQEAVRPFVSDEQRYADLRASFNPLTPKGLATYTMVAAGAGIKARATIAARKAPPKIPEGFEVQGYTEVKYQSTTLQPWGKYKATTPLQRQPTASQITAGINLNKHTIRIIEPVYTREFASGTQGGLTVDIVKDLKSGVSITKLTENLNYGRTKVSFIKEVPGQSQSQVQTTYYGLVKDYTYKYTIDKPLSVGFSSTATKLDQKQSGDIQIQGEYSKARDITTQTDTSFKFKTNNKYDIVRQKETSITQQQTNIRTTQQVQTDFVVLKKSFAGSDLGQKGVIINTKGVYPQITKGKLTPVKDTTVFGDPVVKEFGLAKITATPGVKTQAPVVTASYKTTTQSTFTRTYYLGQTYSKFNALLKSKSASLSPGQTEVGLLKGEVRPTITAETGFLNVPSPSLNVNSIPQINLGSSASVFSSVLGLGAAYNTLNTNLGATSNKSINTNIEKGATRPKPISAKITPREITKTQFNFDYEPKFDIVQRQTPTQRQAQRVTPKPRQKLISTLDGSFNFGFTFPNPRPPTPRPPPNPPPNIPRPDIDIDLPGWPEEKRRKRKKLSLSKQRKRTKYTPSITAIGLNIRGKKPKGIYLGLRLRPIVGGGSI